MAHQLLLMNPPTRPYQVGRAAIAFLLCAFAVFKCASPSQRWHCWGACYGTMNRDTVIQLSTEAMFLTDGAGDQEASVCQKNIHMGGKCTLPDFSGVVIYDSAGNIAYNVKASRAMKAKMMNM